MFFPYEAPDLIDHNKLDLRRLSASYVEFNMRKDGLAFISTIAHEKYQTNTPIRLFWIESNLLVTLSSFMWRLEGPPDEPFLET